MPLLRLFPKMTQSFQKRKEDFICEKCEAEVLGDGYTNHCPHCLYGKHVDINPGDRANDCGGLMRPISIEEKEGEPRIVHECEKCGHRKVNRIAENERELFLTQRGK